MYITQTYNLFASKSVVSNIEQLYGEHEQFQLLSALNSEAKNAALTCLKLQKAFKQTNSINATASYLFNLHNFKKLVIDNKIINITITDKIKAVQQEFAHFTNCDLLRNFFLTPICYLESTSFKTSIPCNYFYKDWSNEDKLSRCITKIHNPRVHNEFLFRILLMLDATTYTTWKTGYLTTPGHLKAYEIFNSLCTSEPDWRLKSYDVIEVSSSSATPLNTYTNSTCTSRALFRNHIGILLPSKIVL